MRLSDKEQKQATALSCVNISEPSVIWTGNLSVQKALGIAEAEIAMETSLLPREGTILYSVKNWAMYIGCVSLELSMQITKNGSSKEIQKEISVTVNVF